MRVWLAWSGEWVNGWEVATWTFRSAVLSLIVVAGLFALYLIVDHILHKR